MVTSLYASSPLHASCPREIKQQQPHTWLMTWGRKFHPIICFIALAFVNYLHWGHRKESVALKLELIHAASIEIKTTFVRNRIIWLSPRSCIPWQNHRITAESFNMVLVHVRLTHNLLNQIRWWCRALKWKWIVLKSYKNFTVTDNIPESSWEVWNNCLIS